MYLSVDAGASATTEGPVNDIQTFSPAPRTESIYLQSGSVPWRLQAIAGNGKGDSDGQVNWLSAANQITSSARGHHKSSSSAPSAALAGFDASLKITFSVAEITNYRITGHVQADRDLNEPEVVACQVNGVVLAGDSRATPLATGQYPFIGDEVIFPGEFHSIECAAASSGGTADENHVYWEMTATFTAGAATTSTTLTPLSKKECKRACRQAKAACKAACPTEPKAEKKACRKSCKRRGKGCGQATGCALPVE